MNIVSAAKIYNKSVFCKEMGVHLFYAFNS